MIIKIKFRLTPAGGAYVTDEAGNELYTVKGKVLSVFRTKTLLNTKGEKIYTIRNKFCHWPLTKVALIKDNNGNKITVKNFFVSASYKVIGYSEELTVEGRILSPAFGILRNGEVIAKGHSEFSISGAFVIDVANKKDNDFMVALMVALNNIRKDKAND